MIVGISDKVLDEWLKDKCYLSCSDEGESIAMCCGAYLATGKKSTAFMSADGFMNALNFITSWMIPEKIPVDFVISTGRTEPSHIVATTILPKLLKILKLSDIGCNIKIINKL